METNNYKPGECKVRKLTPEEIAEHKNHEKELREKYPWRFDRKKDPYQNYIKKSMEREAKKSRRR